MMQKDAKTGKLNGQKHGCLPVNDLLIDDQSFRILQIDTVRYQDIPVIKELHNKSKLPWCHRCLVTPHTPRREIQGDEVWQIRWIVVDLQRFLLSCRPGESTWMNDDFMDIIGRFT